MLTTITDNNKLKDGCERNAMEAFDLEKIYDDEISPKMKQIIEICKKHKIPFAFTACYKNDPEDPDGAMFCSTIQHFEQRRPKGILQIGEILYPNGGPALQITTEHANGSKAVAVALG